MRDLLKETLFMSSSAPVWRTDQANGAHFGHLLARRSGIGHSSKIYVKISFVRHYYVLDDI